MNTPSVIIPLQEYEELKHLRDNVYEAFKNGQPILYCSRFAAIYQFSLINAPETVKEMFCQLEEAKAHNAELYKKNYELEQKLAKKRKWLW